MTAATNGGAEECIALQDLGAALSAAGKGQQQQLIRTEAAVEVVPAAAAPHTSSCGGDDNQRRQLADRMLLRRSVVQLPIAAAGVIASAPTGAMSTANSPALNAIRKTVTCHQHRRHTQTE